MTEPSWETIEAVFFDVLEVPEEERGDLLDRLCGGDEGLRGEVAAMLTTTARPGVIKLDRLLDEKDGPPPSRVGEVVGQYRLIELLGRGGMGEVYLGERADGAFEHQVAVKLVREGFAAVGSRRRFEAERQILARLDHPHIARLLDGGSTKDGQPYLVMQAVFGEPITQYCDRRHLKTEQRLRLFAAVGRAIEFAHQQLVVHLDLKPSNVLVTPDGYVRVLDFGIARLLDETGEPDPGLAGGRALTPDYASPEQMRGEPTSAASDVYGLGVLLHRLLTGSVPDGNEPSLDPDLQHILRKALKHDSQERYPSVGAFVTDINRYLTHYPVEARIQTVGYRLRRYVRRNRTLVAATTAVVVAVLGFGTTALFQARVATEQRDIAAVEAERAEEVVGVLVDLFTSTSAADNPGADTLSLAGFLANSEENILDQLTDRPAVLARLQTVLGQIRQARGENTAALAMYEIALDQQVKASGRDNAEYATIFHELAKLKQPLEGASARPLLAESLALHERWFEDPSPRLSQVLLDLSRFEDDPEQRIALIERAMGMKRSLIALGDSSEDARLGLARGLNTLGNHYFQLGKPVEARSDFREALEIVRDIYSEDHNSVLQVTGNLATVVAAAGDYDEAEQLRLGLLAARRRLFDEPHPAIANDLSGMANLALLRGRYAEADSLFSVSLEMRRELGARRGVRLGLRNLALARRYQGRSDSALPLIDEAVSIGESLVGSSHSSTLELRALRASFVGSQDPLAAVDSLRTVLTGMRELAADEGAGFVADAEASLGRWLLEVGEVSEAEEHLTNAVRFKRETLGEDHLRVRVVEGWLGIAASVQGRQEYALSLLTPAYEAVLGSPTVLPSDRERFRNELQALGAF